MITFYSFLSDSNSTGKFSLGVQNEARQRLRVLQREGTDHSKHPLPQHEKTLHMDTTRWSIPKSTDYILCSQTWRSSISQK